MPSPDRFLERLRALCLALPEVVETVAWGHPNFKAGKRTFAVYEEYEGKPCLCVKQTPADQALLLDQPGTFKPPYVGGKGWIGLWTKPAPRWSRVEVLVTVGYRLAANQRMLRALQEGHA